MNILNILLDFYIFKWNIFIDLISLSVLKTYMYVCVCVCMYVCMYVCIGIPIHPSIYSQVHKYWDIDTILTFLALYTTTMDFKWNEQDVL